jgi:hypothetical protein
VECINQPKVLVQVNTTSICPNRLARGWEHKIGEQSGEGSRIYRGCLFSPLCGADNFDQDLRSSGILRSVE